MNDQENFLSRWSRRKRETASETAPADTPAPADADMPPEEGGKSGRAVAAREAETEAAPNPEFDPDSLPSLDSIGAGSDMRLFMQKGVPSQLRNAALRRAWTADPAIRDFVGLEENAWDFTDPNAMEGFGALDPNIDLKKLVDEIFRDTKIESAREDVPSDQQQAGQTEQSEGPEGGVRGVSSATESGSASATPQQLASLPNEGVTLQRKENIATQPKNGTDDDSAATVGRDSEVLKRK